LKLLLVFSGQTNYTAGFSYLNELPPKSVVNNLIMIKVKVINLIMKQIK